MTRGFAFIVMLSLFCHAAGALAANADISISEQAAPSAAQIGVTRPSGAALTLDDATLTALAAASDSILRLPPVEPQKHLLAALIAAPVSAGATPPGWAEERFRLLRQLEELALAERLFEQIPPSLLTDAIAQEGVATYWRRGNAGEACGHASRYIEQFGGGLWTEQQLLCALIKGDQAKSDFSLTFLEESAPEALSPVLKAIAENQAALPPLSAADARVIPALASYFRERAAAQASFPAIPPDFIDGVPLNALPSALLSWVSQQPAIPLPTRCNAAEAAFQRGGLDANSLRQIYQEALRVRAQSGAASPVFCGRADILALIGAAPTPQERTQALNRAFNELRDVFTDRQARALLSEEFRELSGRLPDPSAPVFLLLQAALTHLERQDRQAAERIADHLGALNTMQGRIAAYAVRQAIAFSVTNAYDTTAPDIDDFPPMNANDKPETVWHRTRVADIFEALNYPVPPTARGNPFAAPAPPAQQPVDPGMLAAFQQARLDNRPAASLLYGMQLLGSGHWDRISGAVLSQVLAMLKAYGYEREANRLAVEALLTPPHS